MDHDIPRVSLNIDDESAKVTSAESFYFDRPTIKVLLTNLQHKQLTTTTLRRVPNQTKPNRTQLP